MKKYKFKLFGIIFIIIFSIFLYFFFKSYNYKIDYKVNEFNIIESYDKNNKLYKFIIKYKNIKYPYIIKSNYKRNRKLIDKVEYTTSDNEICILPKSNIINNFHVLCSNYKDIYSLKLSNIEDYKYKKISNNEDKYNNININYLNDLSYLLFNYKGFYLINNNEKKDIKLFSSDIYRLDLLYQFENYLIIPDYNQKYYFDMFYIINIKNGDIKELELEEGISFDSIFIGDYKNEVYLIDKKEEKEYKINVKRNRIEEVEYSIIKNNELIKKEWKQIKNYEYKDDYGIYKILNNRLYRVIDDIKIKLTDTSIDNFIYNKYLDDLYYINKNKLYMYNDIYGEVLLISNNEWNFNNINMVFFIK